MLSFIVFVRAVAKNRLVTLSVLWNEELVYSIKAVTHVVRLTLIF